MATWTKDKIQNLLDNNDRAVERAIVAIYDRQTRDEKATSDTKHDNTVGFTAAHASKGSYYARWVLSGRKLTGHHLGNARRIAKHYHRQLCEIANAKETQKRPAAATVATTSGYNREVSEPPVGSWASVARIMAEGDTSGFDWDAWKDQMKEADLG
jgi:hypothetical protein